MKLGSVVFIKEYDTYGIVVSINSQVVRVRRNTIISEYLNGKIIYFIAHYEWSYMQSDVVEV